MSEKTTLDIVVETDGIFCSRDCPFYDSTSSPTVDLCRLFGPIYQDRRSQHCHDMEKRN